MRIALIGPSYPFRGGIAHYTTVLLQALNKKHTALLFGFKRQYPELFFPGKTQKDESQAPFTAEHCHLSLDSINPVSWWQTYRRIRQFNPDMVLLCWWHPFFSPCYAALSHLLSQHGEIPCYFLCHNVLPHEQSMLDKCATRLAFAYSSGFIVHARQQARQLKTISSCRTLINPHPNYDCFTASQRYSRQEARRLLRLANKKVVLFFGLIRNYKGLQFLLQAMQQLPKDYHLLLVGEFYEPFEIYRPAIDELRARRCLTLVDRYVANEEVELYFKAADVLAAPYTDATQSGVIQIAYSFNLPVIATRVGGLPEIVMDGETGYLMEPKSSTALVEGIDKFFRQQDRTRFKQAIKRRQYLFSWEHMVSTIEQLSGRTAADFI